MDGWDRRKFLKAGVFGSAGLAFDNKRRLLDVVEKPSNERTARSLRKFLDPAPTVCRMCQAHCGIVAFRDGDRVVQMQGSVGAPTNRGGLCSRGYAGIERLYDAERQLRPLRQSGGRGSGQWEPVSWEEALDELRTKLWAPGARSVLHVGQEELLVQELRSSFGWDQVLVDRPLAGRPGPGSGETWYGAPVLAADVTRARTIFLLGNRPLDGRFLVPLAIDLMKAQQEGASIHLFDSFQGATGSLTHWYPLSPGSEAVIGWGIARLLFQWGTVDLEDLATRLVDTPEALSSALSPYTPEFAEEMTGVPAAQIVQLARRFARERPSLALASPGSAAAPAAALLNHLMGSINAPGGVMTARGPFFVEGLRPALSPEAWLDSLVAGDERVDLYWVADANPGFDAPRSAEVKRALADPDRVGYLVAMDTHLTETAEFADLFLPLATHFEAWGLVEGALADGRSYLFLQNPVTRPASEAKKLKEEGAAQISLFEVWPRALGQARSLSDVLLYVFQKEFPVLTPVEDTRAYLNELLRKAWGPGSLEALEIRGIWVSEEGRQRRPVSKVSLLQTIPPAPAVSKQDEGAPQPLFLLSFAPATLPRTFPQSRWGREINHRFEAFLNRETARAMGFRDGEGIIVRTQAGEVRAPARLVQGIHPRCVALPDGFGNRVGHDTGRLGSGTRAYAETGWWTDEGQGASVRALYPFRIGDEGLQDWGPLPVEVERA